MNVGAAPHEQERFAQLVQAHLSNMSVRLLTELREVIGSFRLVSGSILSIETSFDTMGAPFSLSVQAEDGISLSWTGPESLFDRLNVFPSELQDEPYWDDEWIERTMHLIAPWMAEAWNQTSMQEEKLNGFLFSFSYDRPERFNLNTECWESTF